MNEIMMAVALLMPMKDSGVKGAITLTQDKGFVVMAGEVTGLKPGKHGFHIHAFGDLRDPEGNGAGGHYNPDSKPHGMAEAAERHQGDFGNIEADANGVAKVNIKANGLELHKVLGRAIVVHGNPDDGSQPTGNAGPRVAVGVIGLAENKAPAAK